MEEEKITPESKPASSKPSFALVFTCLGLTSFLASTYLLAAGNVGNAEIEAKFASQVYAEAYTWPMVAFGTAFCLNFLTLLFERESAKFQLALLTCYINFLAGLSDYLQWRGYAPTVLGTWGHGIQIVRLVMYLHTTPAMVYLLSIVSDFNRTRIFRVLGADIGMLAFYILAEVCMSKPLSVLFYCISYPLFGFVIHQMYHMFDASLDSGSAHASKDSLTVLRNGTILLWLMFPMLWCLTRLDFMDINTEEWAWTMADFLGKVLFSSSLLFGNFVTIEQRKILTIVKVIQELQDLLEQKESFLSSMSHELRTPLNGIIGLSDALLIGSCGAIEEKVNISHISDDVIDLCQPLAKRGQILHNLIGNSCKFTHSGFISISAEVLKESKMMRVSVSDTGIGIPEDKFNQIFMAFEQIDMSTTRKYGGTGLGLNLVKQLVEAHGGTINVASVKGVHTTFSFTLKLWDEGTTEDPTPPPGNVRPPSRPPSRRNSMNPRTAGHLDAVCSRAVSVTSAHSYAEQVAGSLQSDGQEGSSHSKDPNALALKPYKVATNITGPVSLEDALALTSSKVPPEFQKKRAAGFKPKILSVDDDPINQLVIESLLAVNMTIYMV
eukprot:gene2518-5470_t